MMGVKRTIQVHVSTVSVQFNVEDSVSFNVNCTVEEGQNVFPDIFTSELDVMITGVEIRYLGISTYPEG